MQFCSSRVWAVTEEGGRHESLRKSPSGVFGPLLGFRGRHESHFDYLPPFQFVYGALLLSVFLHGKTSEVEGRCERCFSVGKLRAKRVSHESCVGSCCRLRELELFVAIAAQVKQRERCFRQPVSERACRVLVASSGSGSRPIASIRCSPRSTRY